jgi:putative PIN family toxin of toxin-antitoxin system
VKLVVDTNVLVSALLKPESIPSEIIQRVLFRQASLAYDRRIIAEYEEVLARPKFQLESEVIATILEGLREAGIEVSPPRLEISIPDPDDLPFLEVARAAGAVLVTGNRAHFPVGADGTLEGVKVLSPRELLSLLDGSVP